MTKSFRIAHVERLRELLEGSNFQIQTDPNTTESPTKPEAVIRLAILTPVLPHLRMLLSLDGYSADGRLV